MPRSTWKTVLIIFVLFALAFVVCGTLPVIVGGILFDQQWFVPGDSSQYDPVAALPAVQDYAGAELQFIGMEAKYVRVDGTLDLRADYSPEVEYRFFREFQTEDSRPIGAGGSTSGLQYETVVVEVMFDDAVMQLFNLGMDRDTRLPNNRQPGELVEPPRCTFRDLWAVALTKDAPRSAVAIITYSEAGYRFRIQDTAIDLRFDVECQLQS